MKLFGPHQRLFEDPIGDLAAPAGGGGETALATIPAAPAAPASGDAPAASGEPGTAVTRFTGHIFTDDNRINPAVRPFMESLRREQPILENRLRGLFNENRQLRMEFPGGLQEVRERITELQRVVDDFGGEDQLSEARGELEFFHNLDQQFTAGDPRFIQAMIDAPGGREAFLKLAPSMMAEYERLWPEGFANFVDGKLLDRLRNADFRVNLERLADFLAQLPNTAEAPVRDNAAAYWVAIRDLYNALAVSAKNKPAPPVAAAPAAAVPDNRASELDNREATLKKREFGDAGRGEINKEFARQWAALAKGTAAIQSHIRPSFDLKMQAALKADAAVNKAIQGYFSRNDVEGYRTYMRGQYQKHAARILKAELGHYRTGAVTPPAAGAPAIPPVAGAPVPQRTPEGWTAYNRRLTPAEMANINLDATVDGEPARTAFLKGKAIMKNGTKVTFKR